MDISGLIKIIGSISVLNTLTVEALKKVFEKTGINVSPNILAAVTAVLLSIAAIILHLIYTGAELTPQYIVEGIVIVYLTFLCSTVTFDKVKQAIEQMGE